MLKVIGTGQVRFSNSPIMGQEAIAGAYRSLRFRPVRGGWVHGDASSFDVRLGARLRQARQARGLSLPDVAEELGVSYQQLQKYEAGRNSLSVARLMLVAELLDVDPQSFLAGEGVDFAGSAEAESTSTPLTGERFRLLRAYFALPEPVRLAVLRLIEAEAERIGTAGTPRQGT